MTTLYMWEPEAVRRGVRALGISSFDESFKVCDLIIGSKNKKECKLSAEIS